MGDSPENQQRRTVIGGRHGSPTVTVAMPFSKVTSVDSDLRTVVAELATIVAELAATDDPDTRAALQRRATEIAGDLSEA